MISGNNNIPYTYDNLCYALTDAITERDKLKSELAASHTKTENQAARIRKLEGVTNHAGGTPLSLSRKKIEALELELEQVRQARDEAKEDADHWKIEYEIAVARLCDNKHPRDNGIISEHEVIPKLQHELTALKKMNNILHQLHTDQIMANRKLEAELFTKQLKASTTEKGSTGSVLEDAVRVTSGPRRRDYDSPTPNHERIARLWNAYIESRKTDVGAPLSALDISHMMILLKLARAVYTPTRDSYVDIAGYAQCAAQIAGFDPEAKPEPYTEIEQTNTQNEKSEK